MTDRGIAWVAWRVTDGGRIEVRIARGASDGGVESEEVSFESLDAAAERFGPGFRDVAGRVLASGSRSGRWRP